MLPVDQSKKQTGGGAQLPGKRIVSVAEAVSSQLSVTLTQLRFTSFAVVSSREDFHLQNRAHAGRTKKRAARRRPKRSRHNCLDFLLGEPGTELAMLGERVHQGRGR